MAHPTEVTPHKFPGSGGPPKPKPPKDPARDKPSDPGHGTPPVNGSGGNGSPVYDSPSDPGHGTSPTGSQKQPPAWVIRRQQVLLRAGYHISVDGIWGGRSQQAWQQFISGISASRAAMLGKGQGAGFHPFVPPGMTIYQGRLVTKQAATAAKAIAGARLNLAAANERGNSQVIQSIRAAAAAGFSPGRANPTLESNRFRDAQRVAAGGPTRAQLDRRNEKILDAMARKAALGLDQKETADRVRRLFGPDGFRQVAGNHDQALLFAASRANAHDLAALLQDGIVDVTDAGDVRFIQAVINHHGGSIQRTGTFDNQTAHAVERLYAQEAAADFHHGVHALQQRYYPSGIAQLASADIYGHRLGPAELYREFSRGGPKAVQLAKYLGELYQNTRAPVDEAIQRLTHEAFLRANPGATHPADFTTPEVKKILGDKYANALSAPTLNAFWTQVAVNFDAARLEAQHRQHNSETGFWGNVLGKVNTVLEPLSWTGHSAGHLALTGKLFVEHNLNAISPIIDRALFGGFSVQAHGGGFTDQSAIQDQHGFYAPHDAWLQGWITLSEIQEAHPLQAILLETLADPLNLVGTGIPSAVAAHSGRLFLDYSARGAAATMTGTRLHEASPALAALLNQGFHQATETEHIVNDLSLLGDYARESFNLTRTGRLYAKATVAKQVALDKVRSDIATLVANNFRVEGAFIPRGADALGAGASTERLASHIDTAERESLRKGLASSTPEAKLTPELSTALSESYHTMADHILVGLDLATGADSDFAEALSSGVSLYRHAERAGGQLSQFGKWVAALIAEQHKRVFLTQLAHHLSGGDPDKLNGYLASLGTYAAGHPHLDMAEFADQASTLFDRALYDQILPTLDNFARLHLDETAWDSDGFLINEGSDEHRALFEKAMGFKFKEAFGADAQKVRVPNPNHLTRVTPDVAQRLRAIEFDRREAAIIRWAEDAKWLARPGARGPADGTPVFHGTASDFLEFHPDHVAAWNALGPGHYVSESKSDAQVYAKHYAKGDRLQRVIERRIRPDAKMLDLSKGINGGFVADLQKALDVPGIADGGIWQSWQSYWKQQVADGFFKYGLTSEETTPLFWMFLTERLGVPADEIRAAIEKMGYHGIKHTHRFDSEFAPATNYVVFDPEKVLTAPPLKAADPAELRRIDNAVVKKRRELDLELSDAWRRDEHTGRFYDSRRTLEVPKPYSRDYYRPLDATPSSGKVLGYAYENEALTSVRLRSPDGIVADIQTEAKQVAIIIRQGLELLADEKPAHDFYLAAARWASAHTQPGVTMRPFLKPNAAQVPGDAAIASPAWQSLLAHPPFGWVEKDGALVRPVPPKKVAGEGSEPGDGELYAARPLHYNIQALAERFLADSDVPGSMAESLLTHHKAIEAAKAQEYSAAYARHGLLIQAAHYNQHLYVRSLYYGLSVPLSTWKFITLGLRPGYTVRNVADNTAKMIVRGLKDPRLFFNADGKSALELVRYDALIRAVRATDHAMGTNAAGALDRLVTHLFAQHPELIRKIVGEHGIPIPHVLYEDHTLRVLDQDHFEAALEGRNLTRVERHFARRAEKRGTEHATRWQKLQDNIWSMMGSGPENYAKRQMYVSRYKKVLAETGSDLQAYDAAMADVEHTLFNFDAEHVTTLEDQFKLLFPFVAYWRKTANFWGREIVGTPAFFIQAHHLYDAHDKLNADQPDWLRRYVSASPLAGLGNLPALGWLGEFLADGYADPLTFTSLGSFYRAFKSGNPNLPENQDGGGFLADLERGVNSFGLGINPYLRTIGSLAGVFDRRTWQGIFPQTSQVDAISQMAGLGRFNIEQMLEDEVIQRLDLHVATNAELTAEAFNTYVNEEMAGQAARGETVNRTAAESKIRNWLALQQIVGFTTGVYFRHLTDTDIALYTLGQEMHDGTRPWGALTAKEQQSYSMFKRRKLDPARFDHYRVAQETARVFFNLDSYDEKQAYIQAHPEILGIVHPEPTYKTAQHFVRDQLLLGQTGTVMDVLDSFDDPAFDYKIGSAAYGALVTDDLKAFWARNDTAADLRRRTVQGLVHRHFSNLQQTYFNLPASDREARSGYLDAHPELSRWWQRNNTTADDWKTVIQGASNTFREVYFTFVQRGDWDSADAYLRDHSFIFDFTSAEGRIDPEGHWIPQNEAQKEYAAVAPHLRVYYALKSASDRDAYARSHPAVKRWLARFGRKGTDIFGTSTHYLPGGLDQHAKDYLAVKHLLDSYFKLPVGQLRDAYLNAHPELRNYFAKYSHERGISQHARDFLAIKPVLDAFFALPESDRSAYLAKHPELQRYFDKYSSHSGGGSGFHTNLREVLADNPEIADRYHFWIQFFNLPPDRRGAFIHKHAEDAGIFIYGALGYDKQVADEQRWRREAIASGQTPRAVAFMHVKPLLDIYFSLKGGERELFIEMNPEVSYYLDHYAKHTGIPAAIQPMLTAYFGLQPYSDERRAYLEDHPELKHYFGRDNSPTERAVQAQVEAYFALPFGKARDTYLTKHPELGAFFDARTAQHTLFSDLASAFNDSDPRMAKFLEMYADIIPMDALKQFELSLHHTKAQPITLSREPAGRQPRPPADSTRRIERNA